MGSNQVHYNCLNESLENTTETNNVPWMDITKWYVVISIFLFTIYITLMVSCFETNGIGTFFQILEA